MPCRACSPWLAEVSLWGGLWVLWDPPSPPTCQYPALMEWVRVYARREQRPLHILLLQLQNKRVLLMLLSQGGCTNVGPCSVLGILGPSAHHRDGGAANQTYASLDTLCRAEWLQGQTAADHSCGQWTQCCDGEQHMAGSSGVPHVICAHTSAPRRYTGVYSAQRPRQPQGLHQDAQNPRLLPWEVPGLDFCFPALNCYLQTAES